MTLLQVLKCIDSQLIPIELSPPRRQRHSSLQSLLEETSSHHSHRALSTPPTDLFSLIEWLSPAFRSIGDTLNHNVTDHSTSKLPDHSNHSKHSTHSNHALNSVVSVHSNSEYTEYIQFSDTTESDELLYSEHIRFSGTSQVVLSPSPWNIGVLLSQQFELQMRKCRLAALIKGDLFRRYIVHYGLLRDIVSVIIEFELGFNDIARFTVDLLHKELDPKWSCYAGYALGCYESLCTLIVVMFHTVRWWREGTVPGTPSMQRNEWILQIVVMSWVLALSVHIIGGIVHWRRGCGITERLKQLKIAMRVSHRRKVKDEQFRENAQRIRMNQNQRNQQNQQNRVNRRNQRNQWNRKRENRKKRDRNLRHWTFSDTEEDDDYLHRNRVNRVNRHRHRMDRDINDTADIILDFEECDIDFEDIHVGEAFVRLQRWCNLAELRINDKLQSTKMLMLVLQKYILPLSIALCLWMDPTGSRWWGYCAILAVCYMLCDLKLLIFLSFTHFLIFCDLNDVM